MLGLHYPASQGQPLIFTAYKTPTWKGYKSTPYVSGLAPTISGNPREGSALYAGAGTVDPSGASLTYQWFADGALVAAGNPLVLTRPLVGRRISVAITASSPLADSQSAGSAATALVSSPYKRLVLSSYAVKKGTAFVVTATGLKPGQKFKIQLNKKTRASGRADANGTVSRAVAFKSNTKAGKRLVKVIGSKAKHVKKYSVSTKIRYYK